MNEARPRTRCRRVLVVAVALTSIQACAPEPIPMGGDRPGAIPSEAPTEATPTPLPTPSPKPPREERPRYARARFPLQPGSRGPAVRDLQIALEKTTYDPGRVDGRFGQMTQHAVFAFEKVEGMPLDGTVARKELLAIVDGSAPRPPRHGPIDTFVDVDIGRQILFEVQEGVVIKTLSVSTGNGEYYESTSGLAMAHTPRGEFTIHSKIAGWRVGYLGAMYYPSYFYSGYAVHGSASVPPYPASHGCVRIPMHSTVGFFERNPVGTPVYVHD